MILAERVLFLRHVPLFAGIPLEELQHLAGIAAEDVFTAGDPIIREGEHGDSLYLIVDGEVRIHSGVTTLATNASRQYFGELSIIDGEPRSASVSAATDCLLLRIDKEAFHDLLGRYSGVALAVIQTLTRDLRQARKSQDS